MAFMVWRRIDGWMTACPINRFACVFARFFGLTHSPQTHLIRLEFFDKISQNIIWLAARIAGMQLVPFDHHYSSTANTAFECTKYKCEMYYKNALCSHVVLGQWEIDGNDLNRFFFGQIFLIKDDYLWSQMRLRLIFAHCISARTSFMDEMNPMEEIKILWIGGDFMQ